MKNVFASVAALIGMGAAAQPSVRPCDNFGANAGDLMMRDPAHAAALGITGSDFGAPFGSPFGSPFGDDAVTQAIATAPVQTPQGMMHPANHPANAAIVQQMWNEKVQTANATKAREMTLYPNRGSDVQVERYSFSLNYTIPALATASTFNMTGSPDVTTRPQRVIFNAPQPGFVYITDVKVANVSALIGGGNSEDAFSYSALAVDANLNVPTIQPQNKVQVPGEYSGYLPPGYAPGGSFKLVASFRGPSLVAGQ